MIRFYFYEDMYVAWPRPLDEFFSKDFILQVLCSRMSLFCSIGIFCLREVQCFLLSESRV